MKLYIICKKMDASVDHYIKFIKSVSERLHFLSFMVPKFYIATSNVYIWDMKAETTLSKGTKTEAGNSRKYGRKFSKYIIYLYEMIIM